MRASVAIVVMLLSALVSYTQNPPTPAQRAADLRGHAQEMLKVTPHRVTMTVEMRGSADEPWELYSSQFREVVSEDRSRWVQLTGFKLETIQIRDDVYERTPTTSWRLRAPGGDSLTSQTVTVLSKGGTISKVLKNDNGGSIIETTSQAALKVNATAEMVDMNRATKEWFDEKGRLTRVETTHYNFEKKKQQRNVEVYEYDPTIKIEAPIN